MRKAEDTSVAERQGFLQTTDGTRGERTNSQKWLQDLSLQEDRKLGAGITFAHLKNQCRDETYFQRINLVSDND